MNAAGESAPIVVGIIALVWALRELAPFVLKLVQQQRQHAAPPASPADASGEFQSIPTLGELHRRLVAQERAQAQVVAMFAEIRERLARLEGPGRRS